MTSSPATHFQLSLWAGGGIWACHARRLEQDGSQWRYRQPERSSDPTRIEKTLGRRELVITGCIGQPLLLSPSHYQVRILHFYLSPHPPQDERLWCPGLLCPVWQSLPCKYQVMTHSTSKKLTSDLSLVQEGHCSVSTVLLYWPAHNTISVSISISTQPKISIYVAQYQYLYQTKYQFEYPAYNSISG